MNTGKIIAFVFLLAYNGSALFADGPQFSGVLDTTVNYAAWAGEAESNSLGIEEYANFRLRQSIGERAILHAAFNLAAMSGNYVEPALAMGAVAGVNYAAVLELERLYFRVNGDYIDAEAGLLRLNFGYGEVFGSSDFLNPRNPLLPNARPRGILGTDFSFYPGEDMKLMLFAAAPKNPFESSGGGFVPGLLLDKHWGRASIEAIYTFETPLAGTKYGLHRFGFSLKADLELSLVIDALYTLNVERPDKINGLSASAGLDYSFLDGDLYVLAEYLFNGASSATSIVGSGAWSNRHYLYGTVLYRFNPYSFFTFSTLFCFDDLSFQPVAAFDYEVFQGFTLNISGRLPLDRKTLSGGEQGELGPANAGAKVFITAGAKLRF